MRLGLALGLLSASVLCFEIGLTRLFSFLLHYHYTFLVVAGAIGGLGIGAALSGFLRLEGEGLRPHLAGWAWGAGLAMGMAAALVALFPRLPLLALAAMAGLSFAGAGLFLALVFRAQHRQSQRLYFCDLAGAALGTLWIIPALEWLGGLGVLLAAGAMAFLAGSLVLARWWGWAMSGLFLTVPMVQAFSPFLEIAPGELDPTKPMFRALDQGARLLETRWSAYARTDLVDRTGEAGLNLYVDGGAGSYVFRLGADFRRTILPHLRREAAFFPYYSGPRQQVLIIGPGGGADVLYALLTGWERIEAVEINPEIVALVRDQGAYSGHLYDLEGVEIHVAEGRHFLEQSPSTYDLIALPLVYAEAADLVGYALLENYLFTREAFAAYLDHLRPQGRLGLVFHNHALLLRAVATLASLWEQQGREAGQLLEHLLVVNGRRADPRDEEAFRPLLLVQKEPYTPAQIAELTALMAGLDLHPYFVPGMPQGRALARLGLEGLEKFARATPYDIWPATDEKPFFYDTTPGLDPKLRLLLAGACLAGALVLFLPFLGKSLWPSARARPAPFSWALYAAGLGTAFMLVEMGLLQRFGLFLGYPTLTLAASLFALLLGAALGSLLGRRLRWLAAPRGLGWATLGVGLACGLYGPCLDRLLRAALGRSPEGRVLLTLGLVLPLGALLGACFPAGLRLAGRGTPQTISWMWAANGLFSVCGSALAVVLSATWGVPWALRAGAVAYALAGGVLLVSGGREAGETVEVESEKISLLRAGVLALVVAALWYGTFSFVAGHYWRAAPGQGQERPPVVAPVWPEKP